MPTYVYECRKCGRRFELFQGITDPPRKRCPECRGAVRRVITTGGGLIFKGSGFYITDYRSKEYREKERRERSESGAGSSSGSDDAGTGAGSKKKGSAERSGDTKESAGGQGSSKDSSKDSPKNGKSGKDASSSG